NPEDKTGILQTFRMRRPKKFLQRERGDRSAGNSSLHSLLVSKQTNKQTNKQTKTAPRLTEWKFC
ncbi:hypothetical protein, partial [Streptococcus anginosus]|uniref:hypothetical protein n=1 Tax=Streptococcus anginosus TaxID=1328 RepID=UPI002EDAD67C